jgi:L-asparaginase II
MLATCLHLGYPTDTYREPDHPLQREIRTIIGEACRMNPEDLHLAADGCSVPTFGASIRSFALAYSALAAPEQTPPGCGSEHGAALVRLRMAMASFPENVAGVGAFVTDLMALTGGRIVAKGGAEGLLCLAVPERKLGIAIRVSDGSFRSHPAIALALMRELDLLEDTTLQSLEERHPLTVRNHNGWDVGEIRAAFSLSLPVAAASSGSQFQERRTNRT